MVELTVLACEHGGINETKTVAAHGISKAMLYKLCRDNKIYRVAQGQYILPDDMQDELLSISTRSDRLIFSHETALFLHGISDRTPFEHTITVPSDYTVSTPIKNECKIYYIKPKSNRSYLNLADHAENARWEYCAGVRLGARSLRYDPQPQQSGNENLSRRIEALYRRPEKDLIRLYSYAKRLRIANVLRQYLEILL